MNLTPLNNRRFRRLLTNLLSIFVILAIALPVTQVAYAVSFSPFVGQWQATDIDGSDIRLSIGGPPSGPFQITWTESYISFCDGEAGIVRGTAQLNKSDPNLLEADLHVGCFTTGASVNFPFAWRFHPLTSTLSSRYENGTVVIWRRPGRPQPTPPTLGLRVNYGHDWVESFYEADHMAWVTVTESDGVTVKATAELITEPKDFLGGENGFQTRLEDWVPAPPDIQPNDWVFGWVDNGASAQVQIGDIGGMINLLADSSEGTVNAPWFSDEVEVECHSWGAPLPEEILKYDWVQPNGEDTYSCSWAGEWDIQPGQDVGVGYFGPDGHWVANAVPNPRIMAFPAANQVFGYGWPAGSEVSLTINGKAIATVAVEGAPWDANDIMAFFDFGELHDLVKDDVVMLSGSEMVRTHTVQNLAVTEIDIETDTVFGIADSGATVHAWVHEFGQDVWLTAVDNAWIANFSSNGFQLELGMCGRAEILVEGNNSTNVDWCTPNPRLMAFPEADQIFGYRWPEGSEVDLTINDQFIKTVTVGPAPWDPNDIMAYFEFGESYDLKPGDVVMLSGSEMERIYTVRNLSVTNVDYLADTVTGTADPGTEIMVNPFHFGDQPFSVTADEDGNWLANFKDAGIDLIEGMCGRSDIFDEFTNSTTVDWCISASPTPVILAWLEWDTVDTDGWRLGEPVTLTIGDLVLTQNAEVNPWDPNRTWVHFDVGAAGHDLAIGDLVQISNGLVTKELLIPEVQITDYDLGANTVSGLYDPALGFRTHVYDQELIDVVFDGNKWIAYFDDLGPLMWGDAVQMDADGDEVSATIRTPNPMFYVVPEEDEIFAAEWSPGEYLTVKVNGVEVASQMVPDLASPYGSEVMFDLNIDLQAGDTVTLTDGRSIKELIVATLQVTGFDLGTRTIFGIADPGPLIIGVNGEDMWITVGDEGTWEVSSPAFDPLEWGSVIKTDEDGDQTRDIFMVPWP